MSVELLSMYDEYFLVNAYAPYGNSTVESYNQYISFLSCLNDLIDKQNCVNVVIAGDFNAGPKGGPFVDELQLFCKDNLFNIADLILGSDTFTFLSPSDHNSTSWLDHIIESRPRITSDIEFNYNSVLYDHFPIEFSLC